MKTNGLSPEQQKKLAAFIQAKRAWGRRWVELYEDSRNATVTDRAILDTEENSELIIAQAEWDIVRPKFNE